MLSKSLHTEMKLTFGYRNEYRMRYEMVKWNFYRENDLNYISGLCFVDSTVSLYTAEYLTDLCCPCFLFLIILYT